MGEVDYSKRIGRRDAENGGLVWPEQNGLGGEVPDNRRAVTTVWPDPDHFYVLPPGVAKTPDRGAIEAAIRAETGAKAPKVSRAVAPTPSSSTTETP